MMKQVLIRAALCAAAGAFAGVKLETLSYDRIQGEWNGLPVIAPSRPQLTPAGGGEMEFYDPTTRAVGKTYVPPEAAALRIVNRSGQRVLLGKPVRTVARTGNGAVTVRETYPNASAWWQLTFTPVGGDALDVVAEAGAEPKYWLQGFHFDLFRVPLVNGVADTGALRSRLNRPVRPAYPEPFKGRFTIAYPRGPECYVPAAVVNGDNFAFGVCQLDLHRVWRPDSAEIAFTPDAARKHYAVTLQNAWADNGSFTKLYRNQFRARYRFRFAGRLAPGESGYASLVDAHELWRDYLRELDAEFPNRKPPKYDTTKNNILILHFFMSEAQYVTPENPMGYVMQNPDWKRDPWEFPPEAANATGAELKKLTGFDESNFGPPVQWAQASAERLKREMLETNAQALIVFKTATSEHPVNYIAEPHVFHPSLEERLPVSGPVAPWDYAVGTVRWFDPAGNLIAETPDVAIQAANRDRLIPFNRGDRSRQEFYLHESRLAPGFEPYRGKFDIGAGHLIRNGEPGGFEAVSPRAALVGKNVGDTAHVTMHPISWHPDMREKPFRAELAIRRVERTAINAWAKILTDAGIEIGFLIREDMTVGVPWRQYTYPLDFTNDFQYEILKQRIQWSRDRFGAGCRWFYLDVFGDFTPDFVAARLRADYPDCFFFMEHPNGVIDRTVNGWKWLGEKTELEKFVAPDSLSTVPAERVVNWNLNAPDAPAKLRKFFRQSGYMLNTHRGARTILRRCALPEPSVPPKK